MRSSIIWKLALGAVALGAAGAMRRAKRFDYTGKVALVTGGSRGLGLVLARLLAERGARVAIVARNPAELERARVQLSKHGTNEVLAVACDVASSSQVQQAVDDVVRAFGRIDVLVNDAGTIVVGPFESMLLWDFEKAMATNFWGALHFVRAVLPVMRKGGGGRILNVSSIGGAVAVPHLLPYVASKFALTGFSLGLRAELAPQGVLVTTACPGLMRTGSPPFALFKGDRASEYAWFATSDNLPILSASVGHAARRMLRAMERGRAYVTVTPPARLAVVAQALAPEVVARAMAIASRLLPSSTDASPATRGNEIRPAATV